MKLTYKDVATKATKQQLYQIANAELSLLNERLGTDYPYWSAPHLIEEETISIEDIVSYIHSESSTIENTLYLLASLINLRGINDLNPSNKDTHYEPNDFTKLQDRAQDSSTIKGGYLINAKDEEVKYTVFILENKFSRNRFYGVQDGKIEQGNLDMNKIATLNIPENLKAIITPDTVDYYCIRLAMYYNDIELAQKYIDELFERYDKHRNELDWEMYEPDMTIFPEFETPSALVAASYRDWEEKEVKKAKKEKREGIGIPKQYVIINLTTHTEKVFETRTEAIRYLNCTQSTFSQLLKGKTKLSKKYVALEEDVKEEVKNDTTI